MHKGNDSERQAKAAKVSSLHLGLHIIIAHYVTSTTVLSTFPLGLFIQILLTMQPETVQNAIIRR